MNKIRSIRHDADGNDGLIIELEGRTISLSDQGQSCCEVRYMTVEDDLSYYVGSTYIGWGIKDGPDQDDGYDFHEVQFLEVMTTAGTFTISSHNEHNGYYGGFCIVEKTIKEGEA